MGKKGRLAVLAVALLLSLCAARGETIPPPVATVRAAGLQMSLRIAPGPYFLGQLVHVRAALTNQGRKGVWVLGDRTWGKTPVGGRSALNVLLSGGSAPTYHLPFFPGFGGGGVILPERLDPGQRIVMDFLVTLTASGRVTLLATAEFYRPRPGGSFAFDQLPSPFPHGAPSLQISVSPRAPATRVLLLRKTRDGLRVVSPPNTHPNVLYAWFFQCTAPPSSTSGLRASAEGPDDWQPLPTDVIFQPACAPGWTLLWRVMVGAPGYAITSAS